MNGLIAGGYDVGRESDFVVMYHSWALRGERIGKT